MAARSSRQAAETYAIDENPPPSLTQELPIVSIDMGGVLSAIGTHKLDEAALAALKELGNVVGDDRILLNSFVQTEYGYKKTVRNCETGHNVLRRFFGRGRDISGVSYSPSLDRRERLESSGKRELRSTLMTNLKSVKMSTNSRAALAEGYDSMDEDLK